MVTRTYVGCLLTIALSNLGIFDRFWPISPRFFSLFSVTLLTIQEVISNEINDLRGAGLQVEIGGRSRLRTENRDLKYEILSARPPYFDLAVAAKLARIRGTARFWSSIRLTWLGCSPCTQPRWQRYP